VVGDEARGIRASTGVFFEKSPAGPDYRMHCSRKWLHNKYLCLMATPAKKWLIAYRMGIFLLKKKP